LSFEDELESLNAAEGRLHRRRLSLICRMAQRRIDWEQYGARDLAHFLSMRMGTSYWKAARLEAAARAIVGLPGISEALVAGELSLDKVVELCRFAGPENEAQLVRWAQRVSPAAVRRRADRERRSDPEEEKTAQTQRSLEYFFNEDRTFVLHAQLPAAAGATIASAIERHARLVPEMPGEEGAWHLPARRADALVAICGASVASDPDPDRATVVIHADVATVAAGGGAGIENGGAIGPAALARLVCNARVQVVTEDARGNPLRLGRITRNPSAAQLRQLRRRDSECRFPGCGARHFVEAHHIRLWSEGGRTDLDNLVLICAFHHRLVHEYGWRLRREQPSGDLIWLRPGGVRYRAGPTRRSA
jgi:hypothetical protein